MVALWALTILSMFAVTAGYQVRQRITLADRIDMRNWLHGIAEGGVDQAIAELKKIDPTDGYDPMSDWAFNPTLFKHVPAPGGGAFAVFYQALSRDGTVEIKFGPQDEAGKLNLNFAQARAISRLFQLAAGLDEDKANEIAYAVVDWRDTDAFLSDPMHGAEGSYYEDLDISYTAKNRPLEVLDELLLLHGMTPEIFEQVKNEVTMYGKGPVNINTASKNVLMALGIEEQLADKILKYRRGPDGKEPSVDDEVFMQASSVFDTLINQQPSGADQAVLNNLAEQNLIGVASNAFHIHSVGELPGKKEALEIDAVVERKGKILYWSAGGPRKMSEEEIKNMTSQEGP